MRALILGMSFLVCRDMSVQAQEHLVPEPGLLAEHDEYYSQVRQVFSAAYAEEVVIRAITLPSFRSESVVGIRRNTAGLEAFLIAPITTIWNTEVIRQYETGMRKIIDRDGNELPFEQDEDYQALKKLFPTDFRQIKTKVEAMPLDSVLSVRIIRIWERMLLATRHPKQPIFGVDGTTYHFSMWVRGLGIISGEVWSPRQGTETAALVELVDALSQYATRQLAAGELEKKVKRVEKIVGGD